MSTLDVSPVREPYRVVVWGTGRMGRVAISTVAARSDFDLVGAPVYGADKNGVYKDDCAKLPPGLKLAAYEGPGCAPPLQKPDCVALSGKPRKAGSYTFRISAPDVNSIGVRDSSSVACMS